MDEKSRINIDLDNETKEDLIILAAMDETRFVKRYIEKVLKQHVQASNPRKQGAKEIKTKAPKDLNPMSSGASGSY